MKQDQHVAILGHGHAVGPLIRGNDAPIFDWLKQHSPSGTDLFDGLKFRRVLARPEDIVDIMVESCQNALAQADLKPEHIDMILGSGSVSPYVAPNDLAVVHDRLGLPRHCRIMPLNSDYSAFQDGVRLANDMIQCGTIGHALVACGNNWTHFMDYREPVSLAASDGAGAVVMGRSADPRHFRLVDWENDTQAKWYGAFRMAPRPMADGLDGHPHAYTKPLMKLDDQTGQEAFKAFGMQVPAQVVNKLLQRNGLTGADITLLPHQVSKTVEEAWNEAIAPARYITTLQEYADMVSSSVPVNWAKCHHEIHTRYIVLLGIGMEMHATALLLERG
jgi:3-oxoacyl-[acyl-carrier-protein] synthase-3